ncbi:SDR family NAD(P)-dependent oxidoreductase [Tropicimonas isoalkanivorans]|uniref:NAD(P)-dependent dehydrogenase, short-chain alcohol dehydrogenase family n=1 Tax=Tropicimonas isoalkanivorans TaxID=441112 RepID=A0A1I1I1A7_9RHOB|nr:SDR family NAD(P)-dependent oxidoreductase [Tropicimonas isoalkanivorans]SFC27463.1 NAD(P)-dependent dehydrogenase, short-chain alcohol dehydrogenase family [Tropicimonas isoalkanivorans]
MGILDGKTTIVTGAGGGIGRAVAMGLAAEGANVLVNDIGASLQGDGEDVDLAAKVCAEIKAAGGRACPSSLSITDPAAGQDLVTEAMDTFGGLDLVVNNAGILRDRMFHKMSHRDFRDVLEVHLFGSFSLSRAAASQFREQESGAFVHMTSTSALIGNFGQANYMAAKMALVGMSRGIALDMARYGVRSNCIAPFAWSRMTSSIPSETPEEKQRVERFKQMTPEKVAPLVAYLGSDLAKDVSGHVLSVRNNEIYVFNQMRPAHTLRRPEGWTARAIAEAMPEAADVLTPLERSSDIFTWDPI